MNRFFVDTSAITDDRVVFDSDQSHQILHVLRLVAGDEVVVLDDEGWEYSVCLTEPDGGTVRGTIQERRQAGGEPSVHLTLFQAFLPRDKFEWVLQKGTEVGVSAFVPVVTQRSLVRTTELKVSRLARWQSIVREAAEQCGRGRIPRILEPVTLAQSCHRAEDFDLCLMAAPQARPLNRMVGTRQSSAALWIGPEGGFSDSELAQASESGIKAVGLGPRILRTETAAVVGAALWLYQWDEMGSLKD